jgi:hypothetical protein
MSDGFIVDLPYKFELFDGTITPFSLHETISHLGIGVVELPINQNNTSSVAPPYLGIGIIDEPNNTVILARIAANHLGIGIVDLPSIDTNISSITPPYLGIGIVDLPSSNNNYALLAAAYLGIGVVELPTITNNIASLKPPYLGIGIVDPLSPVNNVAALANRLLGIGIVDKPLINDLYCGTTSTQNLAKKLRFVCEQNKIDIQIPTASTIPDNWLFKNLNAYKILEKPKNIKNMDNWLADDARTDKNNPNKPHKEASRLLTHLIFDPMDKPAVSTWYLKYTLEIEVERTDKKDITHIAIPTTTNVFEYNATISSNIWTIHHQLGFIPRVEVFINNVIYTPTSVTHIDVNTTIIKFDTAKMGMARFY